MHNIGKIIEITNNLKYFPFLRVLGHFITIAYKMENAENSKLCTDIKFGL
jgi:hypothetical protein